MGTNGNVRYRRVARDEDIEAEDAKKKAEEQQRLIQQLKRNLEFEQEPERRIDALQELVLMLI